jgi:hypothetical protein
MSGKGDTEHIDSPGTSHDERPDAEFGGAESRRHLERKLLRKIDMRMCILVVIYILNYVRPAGSFTIKPLTRAICRHSD